MAQRKKFNLGGSRLEMRETETVKQEESTESQAERLVTAIENAEVNTAFNFKMIREVNSYFIRTTSIRWKRWKNLQHRSWTSD